VVYQNDAETLGIEKAPILISATAWPPMHDQLRHAVRITTFFQVKFVRCIDSQPVLGIGLYFRIESQHGVPRNRVIPEFWMKMGADESGEWGENEARLRTGT
jgi:hypothetical protein